MNWPLTIPRIRLGRLIADVDQATRDRALEMARSHGDPGVFPTLKYTETNDQWVLLREHAAHGQIHPDVLRRMRNSDLEYLAGMPNPNPTQQATSEQWAQEVKVVENAIRAARVLQR